jgi:2-oxo-3-hexenedioate decarboxylase
VSATIPGADADAVAAAANTLLSREADRADGPPLTDSWPEFSIEQAYRVQDLTFARRLEAGETRVGVKLGLTSVAKQQRMGVNAPFVAWLTDSMALPLGTGVPVARFIHPRVEPEIAFVMGDDLAGPGVTAAVAMRSVATVHAAFEVIDSRYADFRFTAPDVIADNASSAAFVVNPLGVSPVGLDLALQSVLIERDGVIIDSATGAAVMSHPAEALALAANLLAARGHRIQAGDIVLTGGLTDAYPLDAQQSLVFDFGELGSLYVWSASDATD